MTEQLKTLKDLNLSPYEKGDYVAKKRLKAEAVKWVKAETANNLLAHGRKDIMKKFFNITKEDLE